MLFVATECLTEVNKSFLSVHWRLYELQMGHKVSTERAEAWARKFYCFQCASSREPRVSELGYSERKVRAMEVIIPVHRSSVCVRK